MGESLARFTCHYNLGMRPRSPVLRLEPIQFEKLVDFSFRFMYTLFSTHLFINRQFTIYVSKSHLFFKKNFRVTRKLWINHICWFLYSWTPIFALDLWSRPKWIKRWLATFFYIKQRCNGINGNIRFQTYNFGCRQFRGMTVFVKTKMFTTKL